MVNRRLLSLALLLCSLVLISTTIKSQTTSIHNLRCEWLHNPEGIDAVQPRLSWEVESSEQRTTVQAYQLLVASTKEKLADGEGDLWNSGKQTATASAFVTYNGKPLRGRQDCYWKVKVWTDKGETAWSEASHWSMGLLYYLDWKGRWIGLDRSFPWDNEHTIARLSARYLRKEFKAAATVKKAKAYIMGLGLYELYINGTRIGNDVLAPVPTDYTKGIKYNTFDVTDAVKKGNNAIGVILGNGRFYAMRQDYKPYKIKTFGYPKLLFQLEVEYADGKTETIITDESWKITADGPIRSNNEYDGEEYDATKDFRGWTTSGFNDKAWLTAELVQEPGGSFEAAMNENMKVMDVVKPVAIKKLASGKYIMDMGQNMAGWLQMKLRGKKGDTVTLKFAETLKPDGGLYIANLRDARVTDKYVIGSSNVETWHPRFVYHGFRYVELTNYPGTPSLADFEGQVVYDNMQTTGSFITSNPVINSIYKAAYWGIRSNYKGMPVDCPQRNERQPWLGDRTTGSYGESFVFDNSRLYAKWLDDIEQAQKPDGSIPDVAPAFWRYYGDNVTWPGTYLTVANMLYHQYGDSKPIIKHYASMKKWMLYMKDRYMKDGLITKDKYGDWCVPPESPELIHSKDPARNTDGVVIATAYYYYLLTLMQDFAALCGQAEDKKDFSNLGLIISQSFNKAFLDNTGLQYSNNTVTANLLPLSFGITPDNKRKDVFQSIVAKTVADRSHISTGVIGTQWLMRGLTQNGRADLAYWIASNTDYPSWGYMIKNGATTIWELWNGNTADPAMNSGNHVMLLGDLIIWFYEDLAGIKSDGPGFEKIIMKPSFVEGLDSVTASYQSVRGLIKSSWKKERGGLRWKVSVPVSSTATIYIPANSEKEVSENGQPVSTEKGLRFLGIKEGNAVIKLGSGSYEFVTSATIK